MALNFTGAETKGVAGLVNTATETTLGVVNSSAVVMSRSLAYCISFDEPDFLIAEANLGTLGSHTWTL